MILVRGMLRESCAGLCKFDVRAQGYCDHRRSVTNRALHDMLPVLIFPPRRPGSALTCAERVIAGPL